jgi:hypothetical protein
MITKILILYAVSLIVFFILGWTWRNNRANEIEDTRRQKPINSIEGRNIRWRQH